MGRPNLVTRRTWAIRSESKHHALSSGDNSFRIYEAFKFGRNFPCSFIITIKYVLNLKYICNLLRPPTHPCEAILLYDRNQLGSYHFLPGGGGRLSVIASRQFFLVPPLAYGEKFWSPPLPTAKNFGQNPW